MTFAENLKKFRTKKELTQEELANKTGINRKTISRYERGETLPRTREYYDKLAEALELSYEELVSPENDFILNIKEEFGSRDAKNAEQMVNGVIGLMAGGELPDEDKTSILKAINEAYYMAKMENKKYVPQKYKIEKE